MFLTVWSFRVVWYDTNVLNTNKNSSPKKELHTHDYCAENSEIQQ